MSREWTYSDRRAIVELLIVLDLLQCESANDVYRQFLQVEALELQRHIEQSLYREHLTRDSRSDNEFRGIDALIRTLMY